MSQSNDAPDVGGLNLSNSDPDALFDTPEPKGKRKAKDSSQPTPDAAATLHRTESRYSTEEAREAALRQELESVRNVNKVIEDVVESLGKAKNNMDTVSRTVNNASTLLNTWTRILSQTEHNQRLILNHYWHGATNDIAELENDAIAEQQAAERRRLEEQARREAAAKKAEEDERRREAAASRGSRGARGRSKYGTRTGPTSTSGTGYVGVGGQRGVGRGTASSRRAGSGIGRGVRGRGRG